MTKEQDDIDRMASGFGAALAITDAIVNGCHWSEDEDGNWSTDCLHMFILNDAKPSDNGMKFCCYCGKPLKEVPYTESES